MIIILKEFEGARERTDTYRVKDVVTRIFNSLYNDKYYLCRIPSVVADLESIYGRIPGINKVYSLYYDGIEPEKIKQFLFNVVKENREIEDMLKIIKESNGYDPDIIEAAQMYFETGCGLMDDYRDWVKEEGDSPETERRYEDYMELINFGPEGFSEEFYDDEYDYEYDDEYDDEY